MKNFTRLITLCILLSFVLSGCGNAVVTENVEVAQKAKVEGAKNVYLLNESANPVNGVSITATDIKKTQDIIKGDKVASVLSENKGYYEGGDGIVPTNDYTEFDISFTVQNNSDKAIGLSEIGWSAKLLDGYKINTISVGNGLIGQVASHNSNKGDIKVIIDKSINAKEFLLTYKYLDYNEEWSKAAQDLMYGKLTEADYSAKYKPVELVFKAVQ